MWKKEPSVNNSTVLWGFPSFSLIISFGFPMTVLLISIKALMRDEFDKFRRGVSDKVTIGS